MASTNTVQLVNGVPLPSITFGIKGYVNYDSASRVNNTVSVVGANGGYTITSANSSSYWVGSWTVKGWYQMPSGTTRGTKDISGGEHHANDTFYTSETNFSFSVGASATSVSTRNYGQLNNTSGNKSQSLGVPALGSPSTGTPSVSGIGVTGATINYSGSAGTNATFSSMRLDYGTTTSYGTNQSKSTASGSFVLTNLTPGTTYHYKLTATNGGGKTAATSDLTFTLLPAPNTNAVLLGIIGVM